MTIAKSSSNEGRSLTMHPRVSIWEARHGAARRQWLNEELQRARDTAKTFFLSCDFDRGGPWAGVGSLLETMLDSMQFERPDLIERHTFELVYVLPRLRRSLAVSNPTLTDLASDEEKVRNYPVDRALRIPQGLIDLLDSWKSAMNPGAPWLIACDDFDRAGAIGGHFFRELIRRRGDQLDISLVLGVSPGQGARIASTFHPDLSIEVFRKKLTGDTPLQQHPISASRKAADLEARIGEDRLEKQIHLPEMITLWRAAGRPDKVVEWRYFGLALFSNLGFYADALRYSDGLLDEAIKHLPDDDHLRWAIIIKTLNTNTAMLNASSGIELAERAQELAEQGVEIVDKVRVSWRIQLLYLTAMLYARYMKPRNLTKGEECLNRAFSIIQTADIPEGERHFQSVFNRNGLAMIRSFQGRPQEALDLCLEGIAQLNAHLSTDRHRLHRSILNYNIGQVYVATDHLEEALPYFSTAMEMDPNYSEYYNDRGNIYLKLGRLNEARSDYLRAIELSPPYHEVFTNLGQCYRELGEMTEAIQAYTRALDLQPDQSLALLGRANAFEVTGDSKSAIEDYTVALQQDSSQWEALANRGSLFYGLQEYVASLADLTAAIKCNDREPNLYLNRSIVLTELGRYSEVITDLERALSLEPDAECEQDLRRRLAAATQFQPEVSRLTADAAHT